MHKNKLKVKILMFLIVMATGCFTLFYYSAINYLLFGDVGFVPTGRIVFASKFGYFDYLILPLGLFLGMKIYRNRFLNQITFRQLFTFGLITAICASFCFSAFIFIYLQFIEPDYFHKLTALIGQLGGSAKQLTSLEKDMLTSAKSINEIALLRNPLFYTMANFSIYIIIGTLSTLLFATFLKTNRQLTLIETYAI